MAVAILEPAFSIGEVAPSLFGRFDQARMHVAAATFRNGFVSYRGGFYSRAGTKFVGFSKQTGRSVPPRLIPFQFSINQGLALEFGNYYMRVVSDGAFVTESPFAVTGVNVANPAQVSFAILQTALTAAANNGAIAASYVRGEVVTLAGGTFSTAAQLIVTTTTVAKLTLNAAGSGYAIGDTLTLASNGNFTLPPVITVLTLSGSGVATFAISNGGSFAQNGNGNFTQASTSGAGSGATFTGGLFGPLGLGIQNAGSYSVLPANPVNQAATTGSGAGTTFTMTWATPAALAAGDWIALANFPAGSTTQLNGVTAVISALTGSGTNGTVTLADVYGNPLSGAGFTPWTSGGTLARIFTLTTIYAEADLEYLKFTQSADVMSICCVNQQTLIEYPPLDLARTTDTQWTFNAVAPAPTIAPPTSPSIAGSTSGAIAYAYEVTSISPVDGTESIASAVAALGSLVNIAATAGSITVTWTPVAGVQRYNVYKATPYDGAAVPSGAAFGFAGFAYGTQFIDSNIVADFTQVPPTHQNPFARGQILGVNVTNGGSGASFTATISSLTGSGAVLETVVVSSALAAVIVLDPGQNYLPTDTIAFSNSATGTLSVGPQSGTYPSVPAYFQERRVYAATLNDPDTYFMSQPGSFTNFDARDPTIDSDAITGSPWAVEVNGIQFMLPMPGGLMVLTGLSAWLLNGSGGSAINPQPITPATQSAQPQAYNGCSQTVPPFKVDYDVIYLQAKGSIYRRFNFNLYANIYTGEDITINSSHLFTGYTIREHAWCEEPYKVCWAVRGDGILLSATINKPQEVLGWGRHDTDGLWQSVCAVTEPPVDALYLASQRFPGGNNAFMIERMDNRLWPTVQDAWCVDCGLALAQPQPAATLTASSAAGLGAVTGVTGLIGGSGYSAAVIGTVVDAPLYPGGLPGPGAGAVPTITRGASGSIATVTFAPGNQGSGYLNPQIIFSEPAGSAGGSGAAATAVLNNTMTFTASAAVFSAPNVGSVIRSGGGIATITGFTSATQVTANITQPIAQVRQRTDGTKAPLPQLAGNWSMTAPVTSVGGLGHLAGMQVTGLADGVVIPPVAVPASGTINLPQAATSAVVGIGFTAQLQSVYLDSGEPTQQGQRKKIAAVTARIEASRSLEAGSNQVDGSTLSPMQTAVTWPDTTVGPGGMAALPDKGVAPFGSTVQPLYTGDTRIQVAGGYATPGQVAIQQHNPLPMQILALIPEFLGGDTPQTQAPKREQQGRRA